MQRDLPFLSTQSVATATGVLASNPNAHALTETERERLKSAYDALGTHLT